MPRTLKFRDYSRTDYDENEIPHYVERFLNELKSKGYDDITLSDFSIYHYSDEPFPNHSLDINITADAERYAKNEHPELMRRDILKDLARYFSIDELYIHLRFKNKEEFANKFLKDFKKHIKTTEFSKFVHSVRFNLEDNSKMRITIITRKNIIDRVPVSEMHRNFMEYLNLQGYSNLKVDIS
jgi:hypothetical protein